MPGSAARCVIVIVFNFIVVGAFYFFGVSLSTCWLTFLLLTLFAGLIEIDLHLNVIEGKLDAMSNPK